MLIIQNAIPFFYILKNPFYYMPTKTKVVSNGTAAATNTITDLVIDHSFLCDMTEAAKSGNVKSIDTS